MKVRDRIDVGTASINLKKAVAGSYRTVRYVYTAAHPVDDTGSIKICFRYAGDFGTPQFTAPAAANYCTVRTTADCRLAPRWDLKGNTRPWGHVLYIKVMAGFLDKGDKVIVTFGDTSGGSPGWQMQTFCEDTFEFKTLVDPIATFRYKELAENPVMRIVAGVPARAVCIAPSRVCIKTPFTYYLKLEDRWGNPTAMPKKIRHAGFKKYGTYFVKAHNGRAGLGAVSNPVTVTDKGAVEHNYYWADFHGQTEETIGSNTIDQYFAFARDKGLLDISGHQGNDFQVTDAFWKKINAVCRKFYAPGSFVTFPGYEWSGNTPLGGDRNVYFDGEGGGIARSCGDLLPNGETAYPHMPDANALFRHLKKAAKPGAFSFAHVGGRYPNMDMHEPAVEVAMEIHSAWGTFDWLMHDALKRGHRVGICANSDGHKCRPGASYPGAGKFGSLGGLTCVRAEKLDRKSVAAAMRNRRFYATTGNRPLVDVRVVPEDGAGAAMGDIVRTGAAAASVAFSITGTAPVEKVEVFNGTDCIRTVYAYSRHELGNRVKVTWSGAEVRGRARLVAWDGELAVSGNKIKNVTPLNFWNPDLQPVLAGNSRVSWQSNTTGGVTGVILELARPGAGELVFNSLQKNVKCSLVNLNRRSWACGGLEKRIEICRLPDARKNVTFRAAVTGIELEKGDNPLYIRITQEDGHMAWTSPVYVVHM